MKPEIQKPAGGTSDALSVIEHGVARLWSEVLQTPDLPNAVDNFFSLGGDSMAMVMLEHRIAEEFSIELPAGSVLSAPTVRELSALIEKTNQERHGSST